MDIYAAAAYLVPPNITPLRSTRAGIFPEEMVSAGPGPSAVQYRVTQLGSKRLRYGSEEQLLLKNANSDTEEAQVEPTSSTSATSPPRKSKLRAFFKTFSFRDRIKRTKSAQISRICPDMPKNFSIKALAKAEKYLKKMNSKKLQPALTTEKLLVKLNLFRFSSRESKRDILDCIAWKLVHTYKSFHEYPDKKLYTTAQLFGGFIERQLVSSGAPLELFLSIVYEELTAPTGSKKNDFGIVALYQFRAHLKNYPEYSRLVAQIQHFNEFPPYLIECVEAGTQQCPREHEILPSAATLTGLWKEQKMTAPAQDIQEKFRFVLRTLNNANVARKCDELRKIITKDNLKWMALHMVIQRVSKDVSYHTLYSKFLDMLKIPEFNDMVVQETLRNVKMLLAKNMGEKIFRRYLKNLGQWLGMITLGKCRPLPQADLDLKALIAEATIRSEDELRYVVSFVIRILESCATSKVFRSPNPWTISIMSVLRELYDEPNLKLKTQVKIEQLCLNLDIRITKLKSSGYLRQRKRERVLYGF